MQESTITHDPLGFPMVYIEALDASMHCFPITKMHVEYFISDASNARYDAEWYTTLLTLNPRVPPDKLHNQNYWHAFASGLLPQEAESLAAWLGQDFQVPTLEQWIAAYKELRTQAPISGGIRAYIQSRRQRVHAFIKSMESVTPATAQSRGVRYTRADQFLMRNGLLEWVQPSGGLDDWAATSDWGGMGDPHPRFHGMVVQTDRGEPHRPRNPETQRLRYYGARFLRRT